ncbi:MAG: helix-turn-helix domain-containing protein [Candidatus Omnitrophica bacterium]|nr:helix-turn-helix domain-containing protein [Candidatus Omnitrophota bacterium]
MERLLTLSQAANYLQFSTGKLYRMAKKGKIPVSKLGGSWRFKKSRIDKWIDELEKRNSKV